MFLTVENFGHSPDNLREVGRMVEGGMPWPLKLMFPVFFGGAHVRGICFGKQAIRRYTLEDFPCSGSVIYQEKTGK